MSEQELSPKMKVISDQLLVLKEILLRDKNNVIIKKLLPKLEKLLDNAIAIGLNAVSTIPFVGDAVSIPRTAFSLYNFVTGATDVVNTFNESSSPNNKEVASNQDASVAFNKVASVASNPVDSVASNQVVNTPIINTTQDDANKNDTSKVGGNNTMSRVINKINILLEQLGIKTQHRGGNFTKIQRGGELSAKRTNASFVEFLKPHITTSQTYKKFIFKKKLYTKNKNKNANKQGSRKNKQ